MADYYATHELTGMDEVRELVPVCNELNWLFIGTSGIHGSGFGLNDLEMPQDDGYVPDHLTFLIVQPRMVRTFWGELEVKPGDLPWLRERVTETAAAVADQAKRNLSVGVT